MTTWTDCKCSRPHATHRGWMRCKLRHARWITGDGPYALVSWCNTSTVTLWPTHTQALDSQNLLHAIRCGSQCRGRHEIVHINREAAAA